MKTNRICLWNCPLIMQPLHFCLSCIPESLISDKTAMSSLHLQDCVSHWPTQVHWITICLSISLFRIPWHRLSAHWLKLGCPLLSEHCLHFSAVVVCSGLSLNQTCYWFHLSLSRFYPLLKTCILCL